MVEVKDALGFFEDLVLGKDNHIKGKISNDIL